MKAKIQQSLLQSEIDALDLKRKALLAELSSVTAKLSALNAAQRVLAGPSGRPTSHIAPITWNGFNPAPGMSLIDALVAMGQRSEDGTLTVQEIGPFLQRWGLSKKRHAWQSAAEAYSAMLASPRFAKVGAGIFKLIA